MLNKKFMRSAGFILLAVALVSLLLSSCAAPTPTSTTTPTQTTTTPAPTTGTPVLGTSVLTGTPWVDTTQFKKAPPWNIGFSNPSLSNEWRVYELDLMQYWVDQNKDLVKNFYSTDSQDNPVKQISDTKDLMAKGIDVLLSSPGTPAANPGQNEAFEKGIPVVQFDRTGDTEEYQAIILTDEIAVGQTITKWLVEKLNGKGNIVVLSGFAGSWPSEGRLIGMKQVLANYPDIHIVGGPVYTAWAAAPAKKAMEDWIAAIPKIDGIWADSGMMCRPAYEAWLEAGKAPIPAVGDSYNGWLKFWKQNNLGDNAYGVFNVPLYCGISAMETAFKMLKGEPVPRTSYYAMGTIDSSNLDQYVRMDLSDAYFAQDTVPGQFTPPASLKLEIFGPK